MGGTSLHASHLQMFSLSAASERLQGSGKCQRSQRARLRMDEKPGAHTAAAKRSHQVPVGGFRRLEEFGSGSAPVARVHMERPRSACFRISLPGFDANGLSFSFGQSEVIMNFLFVAADHLNVCGDGIDSLLHGGGFYSERAISLC